MSNDILTYNGNVKISVKNKKNKVKRVINIKNDGTLTLFRGIVLALTRNFNTNYIPNYLGVGSDSRSTDISATKLEGEITRSNITTRDIKIHKITKNSQEVDNGWTALFGATIPFSSIAGTTIHELGLYGTEKDDTLLARILLTENEKIEVEDGMSLTVEWVITIQNGGDK